MALALDFFLGQWTQMSCLDNVAVTSGMCWKSMSGVGQPPRTRSLKFTWTLGKWTRSLQPSAWRRSVASNERLFLHCQSVHLRDSWNPQTNPLVSGLTGSVGEMLVGVRGVPLLYRGHSVHRNAVQCVFFSSFHSIVIVNDYRLSPPATTSRQHTAAAIYLGISLHTCRNLIKFSPSRCFVFSMSCSLRTYGVVFLDGARGVGCCLPRRFCRHADRVQGATPARG